MMNALHPRPIFGEMNSLYHRQMGQVQRQKEIAAREKVAQAATRNPGVNPLMALDNEDTINGVTGAKYKQEIARMNAINSTASTLSKLKGQELQDAMNRMRAMNDYLYG